MAGYVFAIGGNDDPVDAIRACAEKGIFATYLKKDTQSRSRAHWQTICL